MGGDNFTQICYHCYNCCKCSFRYICWWKTIQLSAKVSTHVTNNMCSYFSAGLGLNVDQ